MVTFSYESSFKKAFSRIKDSGLKIRIIKQLKKLGEDPESGKPMRNGRAGTRELYIPPFLLSYIYFKETDTIVILDFYHKDEQ